MSPFIPNPSLPWIGFAAVFIYIVSLGMISWYRSRSATDEDYLIGSHHSIWWLITLGMISDSLSGVTYVSVPGAVPALNHTYLQVIFGHFFGYLIISKVLLPLFYKKRLITIYTYLEERFGPVSRKMGAFFFVASRTFGSAARLYIAMLILHHFFFKDLFSPMVSFAGAIALMVFYTYKGGIKSLVWTDAFQSSFLVLAIAVLFWVLADRIENPFSVIWDQKIVETDPLSARFFLKQILGGMLITVGMNGLDQNIMQKNLSCEGIRPAQKNMMTFAFVFVFVNFFFVTMGSLLIANYQQLGLTLPTSPDRILPDFVFGQLPTAVSVLFILGLTAATLSSADSALPTLASSIELDLLPQKLQEKLPVRWIHLIVAVFLFLIICGLYLLKTQSLIGLILKYAGYTNGPLLGLFALGIFTRVRLKDNWVPWGAVFSIFCTVILDLKCKEWFNGYEVGIELIAINAIFFVLFSLSFARLKEWTR